MSILDNELVKKYFECERGCVCKWRGIGDHMCRKIVIAMQQPIKKGERYLGLDMDGAVCERNIYPSSENLHPFSLRLPDQFQPKVTAEGTETKEMRYCKHIVISGCSECDKPAETKWQ